MIKIKEAIVVEGRYDKAAVSAVVDTVILETAGFGIFSDREKLSLLRRLAETRGLVSLTDSDGGGFVIRNYLKSAIDPSRIKNAYIPDVYGKERRKRKPGREGKMGVEGMSREVLLSALRRAGVEIEGEDTAPASEKLTKADLFAMGLTGRPDSASRRQRLLAELELPEHLTPNALLEVLNAFYTPEELRRILSGSEKNIG